MNKRLLGAGAALCAIVAGAAIFPVWRDEPKPRPANAARTVQTIPPAPAHTMPPAAPPGAPEITAVTYQPIAAQTAEEINRNVPLQNAGPAARPFVIAEDSPARQRATHCIAQAVYYEAGSESDAGQRAVAQVILNRVRSAAFPNSICGVVYQGSERTTGCQFTFACDGSLRREPTSGGWTRAMAVATAALRGRVYAPVGHATHYHADYVVPYWAASMAKIRTIGLHDFYRWAGNWRPATYFSQSYANAEPEIPGMTAAAPLAATVTGPATDQPLAKPAGTPKNLVIDQKPPVLITGEKPRLDPALDRIVVLRADLEATALPQPNRVKPTR
ncbi:cell wall hydrolase [Sphingomonas sp. GB1N7]|uniref:cell wall hydrolase n=1 Tax=Parasphingomonas caseinilytica TaxID=3096158 RepID=UPI002FC5E8D4